MVESLPISQTERGIDNKGFCGVHKAFGEKLSGPEDQLDTVNLENYTTERAESRAGKIIGKVNTASFHQQASIMQQLNREIVEILEKVDPQHSLQSDSPEKSQKAGNVLRTIKIYYETIFSMINQSQGMSLPGSFAYESIVAEYIAMGSISSVYSNYGKTYYSTTEEDLGGVDFWFVANDGKRIGFQVKCSVNSEHPDQIAKILSPDSNRAADEVTGSPDFKGYGRLRTVGDKGDVGDKIKKQVTSCSRNDARAGIIFLPREQSSSPYYFDPNRCIPTKNMQRSLESSSVSMFLQS